MDSHGKIHAFGGDFIRYRKPLYDVDLRMSNLGFDVKELAISIEEIASLVTLPKWTRVYMGVSENSVPLNPMVNDHYSY